MRIQTAIIFVAITLARPIDDNNDLPIFDNLDARRIDSLDIENDLSSVVDIEQDMDNQPLSDIEQIQHQSIANQTARQITELLQNKDGFCWRKPYFRGFGRYPSKCEEGHENIGMLCYPKCKYEYFCKFNLVFNL